MRPASFVLLALTLVWGQGSFASTFAKPKVLPATVEARWIQTVKLHRTKDGATVVEVLAYVQKMRPREFKAGRFDVGYNGATGAADTVSIAYWIGAKRLPDDALVDLGYHMSPDGKVKAVPSEEETATALEGGRDTFLRAVDEAYRATCRSDPESLPSC